VPISSLYSPHFFLSDGRNLSLLIVKDQVLHPYKRICRNTGFKNTLYNRLSGVRIILARSSVPSDY